MLNISAEEVDRALDFPGLVETLREAFRAGAVSPVRHHHTIDRPEGAASTLLLMPAWTDFLNNRTNDGFTGVKIVTVSPDNNAVGKPAVMGVYLLTDGRTGEPLALIDGQRLTLWRTAAASALAATYLARKDASRLLVLGAGALAPFLARAHAAVRPIREIRVWNRTWAKAQKLAMDLSAEGYEAEAVQTVDDALGWADVVTSATISPDPLVRGELLPDGVHVDLVGGFRPDLREADNDAVTRAGIFVDVRESIVKEAGDIVQPLRDGTIEHADLLADLKELCSGDHPGRRDDREITLFKSAGAALEDLAAGIAVWRKLKG
ncbi:MAG: ornithine cyclodeaminase family protein [Rhizobiaceae bacterium]|nr:ornithine cyclodeaminase family protein [Rhizobiaceae bacterium]MCV0404996.1 ornithine cyclodeaminase family protein [Rhizobiaceae bacterium]